MARIRVYQNYVRGSTYSYASLTNGAYEYNRGDYIGFGFDYSCDGSTSINDKDYSYFSFLNTVWYRYSNGTYSKEDVTGIKISDISASSMQLYIKIYIKDSDGSYYLIDSDWCTPFGSGVDLLDSSDYKTYVSDSLLGPYSLYTNKIYFYSDYGFAWINGSRGFRIPDYAQYDTSTFFVDIYFEFDNTTMYLSGSEMHGNYRTYLATKAKFEKISSEFKLDSTQTISYPVFCESSESIISSPKMINSTSVILYRSIDNGLNWTEIYNKDNSTYGNSVAESHDWNIPCYDENGENYKTRTFSFRAIPPITLSYTDTDAINQTLTTTHGIKYKAVFTALGTNGTSNAATLEVTPTTEMQVLDLTLPSTVTFSEKEDYLKGSMQTFSIKKTTVTDPTRIKFRHIFAHTNLPNTTTPSGATALQDGTPSTTENIGNWITTPNGTYEYRIIPILDGSECYTSSANKNYKSINFVKAGHKLEAIRPIEMGSNKPVKIKLLTTPGKTEFPANSSVKFYVANNGNDDNIVWEELPNSCIGTPSNPDVDQFQFSNTTKTADTWKVLVKIVADKNTATTDFKLNSFTVIINGGEKDTSIPGYKYISNIALTEKAASVRIDIPQGYKKIRIEGYITSTKITGYKVLLNDISTGYSSNTAEIYKNGSSASTTFPSTNNSNSFLSTRNSVGLYNHLTIDLYYDGTRWIGNMMSTANKGFSVSHCAYTMASGQLTYLTLSCLASNYYMDANTEITIMGVD